MSPVCECHNEPQFWHKDPRRKAGGYWRCRIARADIAATYNRSAKGHAAVERYEKARIRLHVGDSFYSYRVPPERKSELMERLASFKASQSTERREAENGWIYQAVAGA